ncbi:unnamed protein product, partial [marine sediment metagenome]
MRIQIAKNIFHVNLSVMKKILDLGEFKLGKKSDDYKYFKKQVMDYVYKSIKKLLKILAEDGLLEKCDCKAKIRQGYSDCKYCGGSGYRNKKASNKVS